MGMQTLQLRAILFLSFLCLAMISPGWAQQVSTLVPNINASGGVSVGPDGNIYVSDFGPRLNMSNGTDRKSVV